MSLDLIIYDSEYSANITHNLTSMASAVSEDFYKAIWRPDELVNARPYAIDIVEYVEKGLIELVINREKYIKFNPKNGWGSYDGFIVFLTKYLQELKKNPLSEIQASC